MSWILFKKKVSFGAWPFNKIKAFYPAIAFIENDQ